MDKTLSNKTIPEVQIAMDERAILFPDGKAINHLVLNSDGQGSVCVNAVFAFNETCLNPRIVTLDLEDAREFGRRLVDAVYQARTHCVISDSALITINVITNGYMIQFGKPTDSLDLFISTGVIWKVCIGFLRIVDSMSPVTAN